MIGLPSDSVLIEDTNVFIYREKLNESNIGSPTIGMSARTINCADVVMLSPNRMVKQLIQNKSGARYKMDKLSELIKKLNDEEMDDIPKYLLLKDIQSDYVNSSELSSLKQNIMSSKSIQKVIHDQWTDGSWGRFHSLSTSDHIEHTTENAIRRLLQLGLDKKDEPIIKALSYMEAYLLGDIELLDRVEKKHDWGLLTRLFVSTWIRIIDHEHELANFEAKKWAEVVSVGFENEVFNEKKYIEGYHDILKPEKGKSIWGLQNFYIVALLAGLLPQVVESRFLDFVLSSPIGIYYIYDGNLSEFPKQNNPKQILRFIKAHELLSKFGSYSGKASRVSDWLFEMQDENGFWDFGQKSKDGVYLPLSNNWRKDRNRKIDCTIMALRLIKNIY